MAQSFGTGGATGSSIGIQFNDHFWSKVAVTEARKIKTFSQLGSAEVQPKHYGDTIKKYVEIPILDERNINDQGIDANGAKLIAGKWYAYDASGAQLGEYDTQHEAKAAAGDTGSILSGNGNLFGGSKDISVQNGAFAPLTEEGGVVNGVGMKRLMVEAQVAEYGIHMTFTKRSLDMDTEKGLLTRYAKELGVLQGDQREAMIRNGLIGASEQNRVYSGDATAIDEIGSGDTLTYGDLRMMDKSLKDARCPKDTALNDGSKKYGTTPIGKARYVYVGEEALPTLEDMEHNGVNIWDPVENYADGTNTAEGEIGRIGAFRFIEVAEMPNYSGQGADTTDDVDDEDVANRYTSIGADGKERYDVFPILFVGSTSFASVGFQGDVARVTTVMPKADAYNDVFGKKGAVSISHYFGMLYLRPEWIRQIACSMKMV
jgi:N4-gp56 family major capsid protein